MPVRNRLAEMQPEIAAWRRDFHQNPELLFDCHRTAGIVAEKLREFGCDEVVTGIAKIGVVGLIRGRSTASGRTIGMRADMDALPIHEATGLPHASETPGKMHACGHDGHTAMLLGAAKYLAETRNFDGTVAVIFQPAEEAGAGGKVMVDEGIMDRFAIDEVYGLHNSPGLPVGQFAIREGAMLASSDYFVLVIEGRGGHGGMPHLAVDPMLAASHVVVALQSIVSRNIDPLGSVVVSPTSFHTDSVSNLVIAQEVTITGSVRSLDPDLRVLAEDRFRAIVTATAQAHGCTARLDYQRGYPVTMNHPDQTRLAADCAAEVVGASQVNREAAPIMPAEDFAFMLLARPGAYIFMGNGDSAPCHHPTYEFNDESIPAGSSWFATLAERGMPMP
jgi:amidohydrolase